MSMVKDLLRVANIFKELETYSSRTAKEEILKENEDDDLFIKFLKINYNPYITTKISTKKLALDVSNAKGFDFTRVEEFLKFLAVDSTGKHDDVATVNSFKELITIGCNSMGIKPQDQEIIRWLIDGTVCKNLKVGITSTTINKVYGKNFIPSFKVMLAEKWIDFDKKKNIEVKNYLDMEGQDVVATLKIDGNRAEVVKEYGKVTIFSREGKEIEGCTDIEQAFNNPHVTDGVYEGELLALGEFKDSVQRFKKTSSILRSKGEKTGLEFVMFDFISLHSFKNCETYDVECVGRKSHASNVANVIRSEYVRYLEPLYTGVFDFEKLQAMSNELKKQGEEGLMVQLAYAPYEFKRVKHLLKAKSFEGADIKCVDMYKGTGENSERLGGIICDYKGSLVKIGSGFNHAQREQFWNNPSLIVGKIVEIQYFEEFFEDGKYDLRFGTFKAVREDKTEESYY